MKALSRERLLHIGSLITYRDSCGNERCLGNLMWLEGSNTPPDAVGAYDAAFGKMNLTKEESAVHNKALDTALVEGLDKHCKVGQGSYAYHTVKPCGIHLPKQHAVSTFTGVCISDDVTLHGQILTFRRSGREFRGRLSKDSQSFNFKRIK